MSTGRIAPGPLTRTLRTELAMCDTNAIEDAYSSEHPNRTLVRLYFQNKKAMSIAIFFYFLKNSPAYVAPIAVANIINTISKPSSHSVRDVLVNGGVWLATIVLHHPLYMTYVRNMSIACREAEASLRSAICRRLQMLTTAFYRHKGSGVIQSKTLRDVETIDQMVRGLFEGGLGAITSIIVAVTVTAFRAPAFIILYFFMIPPVVLIRHLMGNKLRQANREFRDEFEGMSARIVSMIDMIPVARAHAVEGLEIEKVDSKLDRVKKIGQKVDWSNGWFGGLAWALFTLLSLAGYVLSGLACVTKLMPLSPGDVTLIGSYFGQISGAVAGLIMMLPNLTKGFEAVRSIGDILESNDVELDRGKPRIESIKGRIKFDRVDFYYPGSTEPSICNLDLNVAEGSTVAFVGPSGSGKSTLMGLILGFHRPTHGRILLDGRDMSEIDMRSFREHVAVVSQETILFQGTVRENILYGTKNVGDVELRQALKDANALGFIEKLPEGLDTMLGERGARLSGGQKQRIAIARAIIRQPRVLILDEATSSLDSESEAMMKGRTTFIVAHRLSTIRNAGLIVLLDAGSICEMGTHSELLEQNQAFAGMYRLQISGGRSYA